MTKLYWQDAVQWYLQLSTSKLNSDTYWLSLTNHTKQYGNLRNMPTGNPSWEYFNTMRYIAYDDLYDKVFQHFIDLRQALIQPEIFASDIELFKIAKQGCYLAYYPELSFTDPAAEIISNYLFNGETMPPPALWVFAGKPLYNNFENNHLLSWIAPEFVERVKDAVESAPDECIIDASSALYQSDAKNQLIKLGLIES